MQEPPHSRRSDDSARYEHLTELLRIARRTRHFSAIMSKEPVYANDTRVTGYEPLVAPTMLLHEIPASDAAKRTIAVGRRDASDAINGQSDKLLVVVGPCSIHNPEQAKEYARKLKDAYESRWKDGLVVVMRAYFEKPRTTVGWKGLINDPDLDGSYKINRGLRIARTLLVELTEIGVPVACELLDTISPQYTSDLYSWGAIGARTTESQLHRELGTSRARLFTNTKFLACHSPSASRTLRTAALASQSMRSAHRPSRTRSWASPAKAWRRS